MRQQVLVFAKPANEIKQGDRMLTGRLVVAEVESVEVFEDSTGRPCVAVVTRSGQQVVGATNYLDDELVLVIE